MKTMKTTILALTALFATPLVTPLLCLGQTAATAPVEPSGPPPTFWRGGLWSITQEGVDFLAGEIGQADAVVV